MIAYTFFILFVLPSVQAASEPTPVTLGDDVTLQCEAGDDASIIVVEWTRDDLGPSEYVLFYTDGSPRPGYQHPSFKGRVQLLDGDLKHGDVSLVLKNVTFNDSGTYECRVAGGRSRRSKRSLSDKPIASIRLQVNKPGSNSGGPMERQHIIGLGAAGGFALACSAVVGLFLVLRKKFRRPFDEESVESVADKASDDQLI